MNNQMKEKVREIVYEITSEYEYLKDNEPIQPRTNFHRLFGEELVDKIHALYEKDLLHNIGQLRQWLNENRITDPNKMVTNEELKVWLTQSELKEK